VVGFSAYLKRLNIVCSWGCFAPMQRQCRESCQVSRRFIVDFEAVKSLLDSAIQISRRISEIQDQFDLLDHSKGAIDNMPATVRV